MNKPSRALIFVLIAVLLIAAFGFAMSHFHASGNFPGTLMMWDEDLSDSPFAWMIVVPILFVVAATVAVVMAGVAVIVVFALALAALLVALALLLAATPFVLLFAIPVLAIYGLVKLVQRDRRAMQVTA